MFDRKTVQFVGFFFGLLSMILPYATAYAGQGDGILYLFGIGLSVFFALAGLICSIISLNLARKNYEPKAMSIVGLVFSINGLISSLFVILFIGAIAAIVMSTT